MRPAADVPGLGVAVPRSLPVFSVVPVVPVVPVVSVWPVRVLGVLMALEVLVGAPSRAAADDTSCRVGSVRAPSRDTPARVWLKPKRPVPSPNYDCMCLVSRADVGGGGWIVSRDVEHGEALYQLLILALVHELDVEITRDYRTCEIADVRLYARD